MISAEDVLAKVTEKQVTVCEQEIKRDMEKENPNRYVMVTLNGDPTEDTLYILKEYGYKVVVSKRLVGTGTTLLITY